LLAVRHPAACHPQSLALLVSSPGLADSENPPSRPPQAAPVVTPCLPASPHPASCPPCPASLPARSVGLQAWPHPAARHLQLLEVPADFLGLTSSSHPPQPPSVRSPGLLADRYPAAPVTILQTFLGSEDSPWPRLLLDGHRSLAVAPAPTAEALEKTSSFLPEAGWQIARNPS